MDKVTPQTREVSPYTVELSSNLDDSSPFCPLETTQMRVEPHGAVVFFRWRSGEEAERFELSGAEVDALVAANRRRKALVNRYHSERETRAEPAL